MAPKIEYPRCFLVGVRLEGFHFICYQFVFNADVISRILPSIYSHLYFSACSYNFRKESLPTSPDILCIWSLEVVQNNFKLQLRQDIL